jgi:predicted Zn-dependent peptidase
MILRRHRSDRRGGGHVPPAPAFAVPGRKGYAERGPAERGSALRACGGRASAGRGSAGEGSAVLESGSQRGRTLETLLPNGIRVLTEAIPGVRSVSAGVWVRQGSAHEAPEDIGASHLLEHMVFKGTRNRSPRQIAMELERLGGSLDAFTSREHTSYQARVLSEHLPQALDVLADLVLEPLLRKEDLDLEREVVLEEIATVEDTPDDQVFELHGEALWKDHPYGRSILGSRSSVEGMGIETLQEIHEARYRRGGLIIAAAGHLEHQHIVDTVFERFGHLPAVESNGAGLSAFEADPLVADPPVSDLWVPRDSAQTHVVFGTRTPPRSAPERFPLILLSAAFGGGMSSRLFQRVREELALAYTVFSFQSFYSMAGVSGVYVGTRPEWGDRAVTAIQEEFERMASEGLPTDELRAVKDQVKGQLMLSLESTASRLYRLAGFALYDQPHLSLDQLLQRIEGVTQEEVAEVAARWFAPERQVILRLGPEGDPAGPQVGPDGQ